MEQTHYVLIILFVIGRIFSIWRKKITEKSKIDRIKELKCLDDSKIEALGSYEEKSKLKIFNFFKKAIR